MQQEGEDIAALKEEKADVQNNAPLVCSRKVVAICAALSILFVKTGFLSFFFLAPLGYAVLVTGSMRLTFLAAAAANIAVSFLMQLFVNANVSNMLLDIVYFSVVCLAFIWIMGGKSLRTAYRLLLGSAAGALAFLFILINNRNDSGFNVFLAEMSKTLSSILGSGMTPEYILELMKSISLRGGALLSMIFVFFLNRQIVQAVMWFFKRQKPSTSLMQFFTPPNIIWVLSGAIVTLLLTRTFRIEFFEIIAWNVFCVCALFFLTQGAGIALFLLEKRSPVFRLTINFAVIFIILSPLNTIALAALLILGIAEIWLPIRAKQINKEN